MKHCKMNTQLDNNLIKLGESKESISALRSQNYQDLEYQEVETIPQTKSPIFIGIQKKTKDQSSLAPSKPKVQSSLATRKRQKSNLHWHLLNQNFNLHWQLEKDKSPIFISTPNTNSHWYLET